jgi:hypothetical protein
MRMRMIGRVCSLALAVAMVTVCFARANDDAAKVSLTTQERTDGAEWWPTKGDAAAKEYVGEEACASCHGDISAVQSTTPMYHAGMLAVQSGILKEHPSLKFQEGAYSYALDRSASGVRFSASDGSESDSRDAVWAFGEGEVGQTYLLKKNDRYLESRLSYYTSTKGLDITTGHSGEVPFDLQEAFGLALNAENAQHCFSCHTTASTISGNFAPERAVPGVTCEACHGPGARHVAAMNAGQVKNASATVTNPARMSPMDSVDFCGACHRTASDVLVTMPANIGVVAVRFQPYRLEKSRCWGKSGDARITCIACHDPHQPLVKEPAAYDAKCLKCHQAMGQPMVSGKVAACKVSSSNCVSCHMPKYAIPQTHAFFTDHDIRVVRESGAPRDKAAHGGVE